jgi:hypothetical protein
MRARISSALLVQINGLDEVQPGPICRCEGKSEVKVKPLPLREPVSDHLGLMRPVVVPDQIHLELPSHRGIDRGKELAKLGDDEPHVPALQQRSGDRRQRYTRLHG